MRIIFYISGHGYGHAVRDIEIAKAVLKIEPEAHIYFRTAAPKWLFLPLLNEKVLLQHRELDFGVMQKNSFSADKLATFERYAELIKKKEQLIGEEIDFLASTQPDLILNDITPFAFDAAESFGKKAIAVGNFSWDWIYSDYLNEFPHCAFIIDDIKTSYAKAERLFRIPFFGDMSAFPNIENAPLIGRSAKIPVDVVRARFGVCDKKKIVLLGLRMNDLSDVNMTHVEAMDGVVFVAVSRDLHLKNCIHIQEGDLPFEDVLNACDAVLSKPGYSMVSEVIVNQTPIVYVPRNDFAEDPILIEGLKNYAVCEELSQQDYFAGNWQAAFNRLFRKPSFWPKMPNSGAEAIARKVLNC